MTKPAKTQPLHAPPPPPPPPPPRSEQTQGHAQNKEHKNHRFRTVSSTNYQGLNRFYRYQNFALGSNVVNLQNDCSDRID